MDDNTKEAANHDAMRHLLVDLEQATRRQNKILAALMVTLALWSAAALFVFLKLDAMEFATNLIT